MSPYLKICSGAEASKKFERAGWIVNRQKGSHVMIVRTGYFYTLSIPLHKELDLGTLKKLIRQAGLSADQFNEL